MYFCRKHTNNDITRHGNSRTDVDIYPRSMEKHITIKDIARMAGVSVGTIDRVIHNRGRVSEASRAAIEQILAKIDYRPDVHTSAKPHRKRYKILVTMPTAVTGEYWGAIQTGITRCIREYADLQIDCEYSYYNQFDIYSCRSAFENIVNQGPDAVVIGPTFASETRKLCESLGKEQIPYVFVDSTIEGTSPVASFTSDQYACGYLLGEMTDMITPGDGEIALFRPERAGNEASSNSIEKRKGFFDYFRLNGKEGRHVSEHLFSVPNPDETERRLTEFIHSNPGVRGLAITNSRGYIMADILRKSGISHVKIVTFDLTTNNIRCIREGSISAILCQRPEQQGYKAVKSAIKWLLYRQEDENIVHLMPLDIVVKTNLPFYMASLNE